MSTLRVSGGPTGSAQHHIKRLEALLDLIDGVVWEADPVTRRNTFVSQKINTLLGYSAEQWMHTPYFWNQCVHPEDRQRIEDETDAALLLGEPYRLEYRVRTADGRTVWLRDITTPVVEDGELKAIGGVMIDITAQKSAEERARHIEARARSLVENSADVFAIVDPEGCCLFVNPAVQRAHGIAPQQLVGQQIFKYIHRDDLPRCLSDFGAVLASPEAKVTGVYRHRNFDGSWSWVEVTSTNLLRDPSVGGVVCHSRDVTGRKQAEQALEHSEARFRSLVQNASDMITVLDGSGVILYESPSVQAVLGHDPAEMVGRSVLEYLPPESQQDVQQIIAALVSGEAGTTIRPIFPFRSASGEWRSLEVLVTNLLSDPHVGGIVVNSHDVTERQRAAQALELSQQQLLSSEKLAGLGRLTAGLAHEINTPLAACMNYLHAASKLAQEYQESLGRPQVTEDDHREIAAELIIALEDAGKTTARIGEFIRQMRGHTRDTVSGAGEFDPVKLAGDTLAMLAHEARKSQVELHLESVRGRLTLRGEPGRFTQVLTNLVINAIHACETRSGQRRVDVRFVTAAAGLGLQVQDNGAGIAPEVLPRIFEPMFTTKAVGKGTGLGLSILHDIVQGHFGGQIEVGTEVGVGTTFTVQFGSGQFGSGQAGSGQTENAVPGAQAAAS